MQWVRQRDEKIVEDWKLSMSNGASIDDLLQYLSNRNTPTLNSISILAKACSMSFWEARDVYEAHPLVRQKVIIQQCKRMIASGINKETISQQLRLSGYSVEEIEGALRFCASQEPI